MFDAPVGVFACPDEWAELNRMISVALVKLKTAPCPATAERVIGGTEAVRQAIAAAAKVKRSPKAEQ